MQSHARRSAAITALLVLFADQLSKAWAAASLPYGKQLSVISGLLWFRLLTNTGATFSLLPGHNLLFSAATLLVLLAIGMILLRGYVSGALSLVALGAVAGGALGNLVDRVRIAGVVDFIQVRFWPTDFNLADVAIRAGVVALLLGLLLERRRQPLSARPDSTA